ncbi:hypothetical protein [Amycolatopsis sp. cmx-4-68]|uniref:hypothetical protein n=1 Tax=Amycolatopsis sp. cmx-4-68 TaxID=2790938 RepID=UPI00397DD5E5
MPESARGEAGADASPAASARRARVLLAPPAPQRPARGFWRRLMRRSVVGLIVTVVGLLAVNAWAAPEPPAQAGTQQAAPVQEQQPPLPLPTVPDNDCTPDSPEPACHFPTGSPRPSVPATPLPPITELPPPPSCAPELIGCTPGTSTVAPSTTSPAPCAGEDCIPQPSTPPPSTGPGEVGPGIDGGTADCGITNIEGCITKAINAVFRDLVKSALDPLLKLLGTTAFTTPTLDSLPGVANVWNNSWLIVLACYSGLIMIGGIIVMSHESVQSRYSLKEIAPRLVVSFFASMLSLFLIDKAIRLANALSAAVLTDGVDPPKLGDTLTEQINGAYSAAVSGGLFLVLLQLALVTAMIALLLVYVVRVILTLILIASAPMWVACHALPHTDGIARWGWRALGATLGIEVAQSLTLITAVNTFLNGGVRLFSSIGGGLMMLFAVLGLLYILFKIPFWFLSATKLGTGRSFLGGLVKAFVAAKTFGAIAGRSGGFSPSRAAVGAGVAPRAGGGRPGAADPPWPAQPRMAPTPEVVNRRMQEHYEAERLRAARRTRLPSQEPRFLQPNPQATTHDPAVISPVLGKPTAPAFSSAPRPATPMPQRGRPRPPVAMPRFQTAGSPQRPHGGGEPAARPVAVASVPPHLRFQPPAPEPGHVSQPITPPAPAPAVPGFRPAHPEQRIGDARRRTQSVPPIAFRAPPSSTTGSKSVPKSPPHGGETS